MSLGGALLLSVVVAGCGSGSSGAATAAGTPNPTSSGQSGGPGGGGRGGIPGVSGVISQVSGSTLTATNSQGTASKVSWTSSTRISGQSTGAAADIVAGACVSVRQQMSGGGMPGGGPSGSGRPSGMPSGGTRPSFTVPSSLTATAVTILPSAECSAATSSTSAASGSGGGRGFGGGFGGLTGTVSSVSGSGFVFKTTGTGGKSVTAITSSSTTYAKHTSGTASLIQAGKCVEARGKTSNSVLAATSITISESVNGECTSTTGGFGGGAAPDGNNGSAGNAS